MSHVAQRGLPLVLPDRIKSRAFIVASAGAARPVPVDAHGVVRANVICQRSFLNEGFTDYS